MALKKMLGFTDVDPYEEEYIRGKSGKLSPDQLAESIRQYRAINASNKQEAELEPQGDVPEATQQSPLKTLMASKPGPSAYNIENQSQADLQSYVDSVMDKYDALEMQTRQRRDEYDAKELKDAHDFEDMHSLDSTLERLNRSRGLILSNNSHWYKRGGSQAGQPVAPAEEGPGFLGKVWQGAKDTAKYAIQHPHEAAKDVNLGVEQFASMPLRGLETVLTGGGEAPSFLSTKKGMRSSEAEVAKSHEAAGVDPRGTGPIVGQAVGGAMLPVGPTLKAGQHIKNILKGGAFTGGAYVGERVANDEPVDDAGLVTSTGVGGGLAGLLSLLTRGKIKPAPGASEPIDVTPKLLQGPPKPGEVRGGTVYGDAPPGGIAGEGIPVGGKPTPGPGAEAAAPTRPPITHRPSDVEVSSATVRPRTLKDVVGIKPTPQEGVIEAKGGVVPEAAAPKPPTSALRDQAVQRTKEMSGKDKLLTPEEAISMARQMDAEHTMAAKEATLKDVLSGKQDVANVPMKRGAKSKGPKSEAPAPAVQGEAGALVVKPSEAIDFFGEGPSIKPAAANVSKSQPIPVAKAKEVPNAKPPVELSRKRTEDFIKERGYGIREREPFPGEKEYDITDPKSGNVIARGDRERLTQALSNHPDSKGLKLYSGLGPVEEFPKMFKGMLRKVGAKVDDDVTVTNDPHRSGVINTLLRPFETPEFNVRKSVAGRTITDAGREGDRQINRRVRDLINEEIIPGQQYRTTKLSDYFSGDAAARGKVDKVLVLGDKHEVVYTPAQLAKYGLSPNEINMYQGVREALDKVKKWVKELPGHEEFDPGIEGYIPRVWKGDWEIFVNGNKYLKPDTQTSSFETLSHASREAHGIKAKVKDAKVEIKFFPDPEYLSSQGLNNARVVARLKANLERMGHMDAKAIDEAFAMGKSVKGFAKHLLERKDATGYETQDLDRVLNSYFYQAARRVEMQKVKDVAESVLKEHKADLSAGQVRYMQEYVERVAGKPAWDQIVIHNFVQDTPLGKWIDPVRGGKAIDSTKELITHLTLGFGNVGWAMINLDGLTRHVWPLLAQEAKMVGSKAAFDSEKYMLHGIKEFFKNKGLRQQLAHHGIVDIQHMSENVPKIGHKFGEGKWTPKDISMILGTATEEFSRGVAAIARYQMALDHGASRDQAMQAAARFVEQTLGRYSRGGRPPAFTGAIGSTAGLFKTYMAVMLQNGVRALESKDIGTITRYITGAVGVSGLLGLVPGIEDMDSALTKHTGWSPIESMEKNLHPAVTTGLFSLAGVDISRRAGIPELFPNDLKGWSGPVIGRFATTIADIANGEYGEAMIDMLPNSVRNVLAAARGWDQGRVIGRMDKPSYNVTPAEGALHAIGITPSSEARDSRLYQRNVNKEAYRENTLSHLTRKLASGRATEEDRAKFAELGGSNKRIRNEQRRQSETLVERQFRHLPKVLRREQPQP